MPLNHLHREYASRAVAWKRCRDVFSSWPGIEKMPLAELIPQILDHHRLNAGHGFGIHFKLSLSVGVEFSARAGRRSYKRLRFTD